MAPRQNNNNQRFSIPQVDVKNVRFFGAWTAFIIFVLMLVYVLGSGFFLSFSREKILDRINRISTAKLHFKKIRGNLSSYIILEDVRCTLDGTIPPEQIFSSNTISLKFSIFDILSGNYLPKTVILDGFAMQLKQDDEGDYYLPKMIRPSENAQGGQMLLENMRIVLKNSSFEYIENKNVFKDFLKLGVDKIDANIQLKKDGKIKINRARGKFLESELSVRGEIDILSSYESDLKVDIKNIAIWQLVKSFGRLFPSENSLRPTGIGEMNLKITGPIANPKVDGKCHLKEARIGNFRIVDANFKLKYLNKNVELSEGIAKSYDGRITIRGKINASKQPPVFKLDAETKNFNLGEYIKERKCGVDPVSGSFNGKFSCSGDFVDMSRFSAVGELSCEKGMYLNPFKSAQVGLFSKRQETRMGFQSLNMEFTIHELEIFLNRFNLGSKSTKIDSNGIVDFDGTMNLEGTITADSELFRFNDQFREIFALLPTKNVSIPVKFKLTGTPSAYSFKTAFPEEIINKYLGSDEVLKSKARYLLEKYFGEGAGDLVEQMPDISPGDN